MGYKHIKYDTNALGIMQITRPLKLRLNLRLRLDVEVYKGLNA